MRFLHLLNTLLDAEPNPQKGWVGEEEEEELTLRQMTINIGRRLPPLLPQVVRWWCSWWIRDRLDTSTSCISKFLSNSITLSPVAS